MIITLQSPLPSWNTLYVTTHWRKRSDLATFWHELVKWEIIKEQIPRLPFGENPVVITITTYYKSRAVDCDNICAKLVIDGLKGFIIKDDNPKYVEEVRLISKMDKKNPRTEILIQQV